MPWIVGIDEAGYGPNLGPFVMTMVPVYVPPESASGDLWKLLSKAVSRKGNQTGRLWVNDSKVVYSAGGGLARLERHFLPFHWHVKEEQLPLEAFWQSSCLTAFDELQSEPWFSAATQLPLHNSPGDLLSLRRRLMQACAFQQIVFGPIAIVVVFPRQFNGLVKQHDSKAAAPAWALSQLLQHVPIALDELPTHIWVDKLGGRNHYHELLQTTFPHALVMIRRESADDSTYQVISPPDSKEVSFQPFADSRHFPVALASMASKYVREILMEQFNHFWQTHVPGVQRTAGYYGDAGRFYEDIRPARERLGIADELLWRAR